MSEPALSIVATPSNRFLAPGSVITYRVEANAEWERQNGALRDAEFHWFTVNDTSRRFVVDWLGDNPRSAEPGETQTMPLNPSFQGPRGRGLREWASWRWNFLGRHVMACQVSKGSFSTIVELPQAIVRFEEAAATGGPVLSRYPQDPLQRLDQERALLALAQRTEQDAPTTGDKADQAEDELEQQEELCGRLSDLLNGLRTTQHWPIEATLYVREGNDRVQLAVTAFYVRAGEWIVVDYSFPLDHYVADRYEGQTIEQAVAAWGGTNYPEGEIRYAYRAGSERPVSNGRLVTRRSTIRTIAHGLGIAALGLALVGLAAVPVFGWGATAAAVAMWTSLAAGTTSAVLSIGDRWSRGRIGTREDAFDGLTILSNMFGVAGAAVGIWGARATVLLQVTQAVKYSRWIIFADVGANGVQGLMLAYDYAQELSTVRANTSLTPFERINRMLSILTRAATDAALSGLSIHGSLRGAHERIAQRDAVIDLTQPTTHEAHTRTSGDERVVDPDVHRSDVHPPSVGTRAGTAPMINPGFPGPGRTENCVYCAIATDETFAGRPMTAGTSPGPLPISVLEQRFGRRFQRMAGRSDIAQAMANLGPGARGIVFVGGGGLPGHVFNAVVNRRGVVSFFDGQIRGPASFKGYKDFRLLITNP